MESIIQASGNHDKWLTQLKEFNAVNASAQTFVDRYGIETKERFVKHLLQVLKIDTSSDEDKTNILSALKLCCREAQGIEVLGEKENTQYILRLANISGDERNTPSIVADEAMKVMVNMIIKIPSVGNSVTANNGLQSLAEKLKDADIRAAYLFPVTRVLFHLSLNKENAKVLNDTPMMSYLIKLLGESLKSPVESAGVIGDVLRIIFNLTMSLGPLEMFGIAKEPTSEQIDHFKQLAPHFQQILALPATLYQIKMTLLNCLINTPIVCLKDIVNDNVLRALIEILQAQIAQENTAEGLTAILMVLTSIAKADEQFKKQLQRAILPNLPEDFALTIEGPSEKESISSKLKDHMTSSNMTIKHMVQQFHFVLCDSDHKKLGKYVGLGLAAGFLQEEGQLGLFQLLAATAKQKQNGPNDHNRVREVHSDDSDDEEDEDEKEARQLMEKMQRLNDLGVISMTPKKG